MALTIELDGELEQSVREYSAAVGEVPDAFVRTAVRERLESQKRRHRIDEALRILTESGARIERNGRSWHEFSHEGHRY